MKLVIIDDTPLSRVITDATHLDTFSSPPFILRCEPKASCVKIDFEDEAVEESSEVVPHVGCLEIKGQWVC